MPVVDAQRVVDVAEGSVINLQCDGLALTSPMVGRQRHAM
jgi:hypothetical protein